MLTMINTIHDLLNLVHLWFWTDYYCFWH